MAVTYIAVAYDEVGRVLDQAALPQLRMARLVASYQVDEHRPPARVLVLGIDQDGRVTEILPIQP